MQPDKFFMAGTKYTFKQPCGLIEGTKPCDRLYATSVYAHNVKASVMCISSLTWGWNKSIVRAHTIWLSAHDDPPCKTPVSRVLFSGD